MKKQFLLLSACFSAVLFVGLGLSALPVSAASCSDTAKTANGAATIVSASCKAVCATPLETLIAGVEECTKIKQQCCAVIDKSGVSAPAAPTAGSTTPTAAVAPSSKGSSTELTDPLGGIGLIGIINRLVMTFLGMVGAIALLVFVYAGVVYMMAGGSEENIKKAKDAMKYAAIGLALIMGAYTISNFYFTALTTDVPVAVPAPVEKPVAKPT